MPDGWIKLKTGQYVVRKWYQTITSYFPVDVPHIKLLAQNILICISTHCFDKNMINKSSGVEMN